MPTPERIAELAAEVTGAPTTGEALRKVRDLRRELDAFERAQVARALSEGGTFATIARELGISRQAVHRRFRSLSAGAEPLRATQDARRVLRFAREEALAGGASTTSGAHIVLATLRAGDVPAAEVLRRAGATLARARIQVEAATPRVPMFERTGVTTGEDLRHLLAGAARLARRRADRLIEVEHLVLAFLGDDTSDAVRTLRAIGVDPQRIEADLEQALDARNHVHEPR